MRAQEIEIQEAGASPDQGLAKSQGHAQGHSDGAMGVSQNGWFIKENRIKMDEN